MKVGIVTLVSTNYGNRLQNYALQKFISNLDGNIEVYTFKRNHSKNVFLGKCKKIIKDIVKPEEIIKKKLELKFNDFNNKYIAFAPEVLYRAKSNKKLNNKYDYFIAGSDQVWNPMYTNTDSESFMNFATYEKRLSYAASIGVDKFPEEKKTKYRELISGIKEISVREIQGKRAIEELTDAQVRVDVDPTMLLTKEEWEDIEVQPQWYNGQKYVLTYFLGKISENAQQMINEEDCEIINVFEKDKGEMYLHSPSEFIWLIHHAQKIYTDSFHGSVFSLIFGKSFCAFERLGREADTGSRIQTLLEMFNLYNKQENYINIENYDKEMVNSIIIKNQDKSRIYLKNILHID